MKPQIFQGERKSTRKDIQVGGHKSKLKKKKKKGKQQSNSALWGL